MNKLINKINKARKFKAMMIDIDGTLIPLREDAIPSQAVIDSVNKAGKVIHVGIATSRPPFLLSQILDHITFSGPSIVSGGAQVVDMPSQKVLWEKPIDSRDLIEVCKIMQKENQRFFIQAGDKDYEYKKGFIPAKPFEIWVTDLEPQQADSLLEKISVVDNVHVRKVSSWTEGKEGVEVSHALATKQHGIFEVAKLLKIDTKEIIGVGDGYNDFPLLMACGLKVAMGNAVEDLKEIADYVAPSVEDDGVVDIIERFIL